MAQNPRSNPRTFFGELKRRKVYKVAVAYIVGGWALSQGIAQVLPVFDIPNWIIRLLVVLIIIGFPIALIFAWAFEITPEGIKRTADVDPTTPHRVHGPWVYIVLVGAFVSVSLFFLGRYTAPNRPTPGDENKSIAVLPFAALSDDRNDAYFAAGVQEAIRLIHNRLTEFRDLSEFERLLNPFFRLLAQEYAGDIVGARATAEQMLGSLETLCQKDPDNSNFAEALSVTRAVLGQKDAAIKEAERAMTLLPSEKDAVQGPKVEEILALVEVILGDKNRAIPRLQRLLEIPYGNCLTPALLRLHPAWDPLRGDPRFQKLSEEKQP